MPTYYVTYSANMEQHLLSVWLYSRAQDRVFNTDFTLYPEMLALTLLTKVMSETEILFRHWISQLSQGHTIKYKLRH